MCCDSCTGSTCPSQLRHPERAQVNSLQQAKNLGMAADASLNNIGFALWCKTCVDLLF